MTTSSDEQPDNAPTVIAEASADASSPDQPQPATASVENGDAGAATSVRVPNNNPLTLEQANAEGVPFRVIAYP